MKPKNKMDAFGVVNKGISQGSVQNKRQNVHAEIVVIFLDFIFT